MSCESYCHRQFSILVLLLVIFYSSSGYAILNKCIYIALYNEVLSLSSQLMIFIDYKNGSNEFDDEYFFLNTSEVGRFKRSVLMENSRRDKQAGDDKDDNTDEALETSRVPVYHKNRIRRRSKSKHNWIDRKIKEYKPRKPHLSEYGTDDEDDEDIEENSPIVQKLKTEKKKYKQKQKDYNRKIKAIKKQIKQSRITSCKKSPCLNGGTCVFTKPSGYSCFCKENFGGRNCEVGQKASKVIFKKGQITIKTDKENVLLKVKKWLLIGVLVPLAFILIIAILFCCMVKLHHEQSRVPYKDRISRGETITSLPPSIGSSCSWACQTLICCCGCCARDANPYQPVDIKEPDEDLVRLLSPPVERISSYNYRKSRDRLTKSQPEISATTKKSSQLLKRSKSIPDKQSLSQKVSSIDKLNQSSNRRIGRNISNSACDSELLRSKRSMTNFGIANGKTWKYARSDSEQKGQYSDSDKEQSVKTVKYFKKRRSSENTDSHLKHMSNSRNKNDQKNKVKHKKCTTASTNSETSTTSTENIKSRHRHSSNRYRNKSQSNNKQLNYQDTGFLYNTENFQNVQNPQPNQTSNYSFYKTDNDCFAHRNTYGGRPDWKIYSRPTLLPEPFSQQEPVSRRHSEHFTSVPLFVPPQSQHVTPAEPIPYKFQTTQQNYHNCLPNQAYPLQALTIPSQQTCYLPPQQFRNNNDPT